MDRRSLVLESLSPRRRGAVQQEEAALLRFCAAHDLPVTREAVAIYLACAMEDPKAHGPSLRARLALLDVAARVTGAEPWSRDPELRLFLRGMYRVAPLRDGSRTTDPIYAEMIGALVDATIQPSYAQLRDIAVLLLAHHAGLSATQMWRLTWADVSLRRDSLRITLGARGARPSRVLTVPATGGITCPVAAVARLHAEQAKAVGPVFASRHREGMYATLSSLGYPATVASAPQRPTARALQAIARRLMGPTARQVQDRGIILLAFAACLSTHEVIRLRTADLRAQDEAVIVHARGRSVAVRVGMAADPRYCPVRAWEEWCAIRQGPTSEGTGALAFVDARGPQPWTRPLTYKSLNRIVHAATETAGLEGRWGFLSLRQGAIHTAVRAGQSAHSIAHQAGLESLVSIEAYQGREELVRGSLAGHVGL